MHSSEHSVGIAAIVENLIKHQWSWTILRHLRTGTGSPTEISRIEISIAPSTMSERLRTMVRYNLIRRTNLSVRHADVTYRLTPKGRRVLSLLDVINQLEDVEDGDPRPFEELFDSNFRIRPRAHFALADPETAPAIGRDPSPEIRSAKLA